VSLHPILNVSLLKCTRKLLGKSFYPEVKFE
jgi:hypothetical protein